jgi:hypothetical protein
VAVLLLPCPKLFYSGCGSKGAAGSIYLGEPSKIIFRENKIQPKAKVDFFISFKISRT